MSAALMGGLVTGKRRLSQHRHGSALRHEVDEIDNPIWTKFTIREGFGTGTEDHRALICRGATREEELDIRDRVSDMGSCRDVAAKVWRWWLAVWSGKY